ncbi:molybdopterin-dependent oxidoreductase [Bradyrhizobium sp. AUGA SZCCT0176]|uniref:molybdopterin-containing oxidoreductase family protein n=1 Tax=Bradyrhizobium sp. AUGA SZCCT0176 TaxID=2807664 RepID=UPI001BAC653A|nr:molybdopterin-dependent oxidoreductase [Bradyrhizobium sp. AUGA SZCCT0176]MBR1225158.1 molybdopterin-dependent oxidoreductase [Bradyrhizobium sp. AUGA SZCCT0176]
MTEQTRDKQVFFGGCPHDCPDTCAMIYTVEEGRLSNVRGNPAHPITRGGLCVKLNDFADHHYNADRVLYPLKRNGPKGSRSFIRISWEEALAEIKRQWSGIIESDGAEAIMPVSYLGNEGLVQGLNVGDAFFNRLGATVCERTYCASGSLTAWFLTVGPTNGLDPESFAHSKYIIIWGCNTLSTNLHHWPFVVEARQKGAKVVVIDPYKSRTAKQADWHIAPKPGTDGALAMAMIHTIISEGLVDQDYVDRYVLGYPELKDHAVDCTPEWAEKICGVRADDIRKLAREYASSANASIRVGVALERSAGGTQAIRAIIAIPALTGAWRQVAGGIYHAPLWEFPVNFGEICRPDWIKPGTRVVNILKLGEALTGEAALDPPLKSIMVYNTNPVTQAMDVDKIVAGLQRTDLFTVVADHFVSDTAAYADIVLPATMAGEHDDLMFSWGHYYLTLNQKAIEAPGEACSNAEIFRRLAATMGFDDPQFRFSDKELVERTINWAAPEVDGITLDVLREKGFAKLNLGAADTRTPHAEGNFKTPSGKCEILLVGATDFVAPPFRQLYEAMQGETPIEPLPGFTRPYESPDYEPELAKLYPLNIVAPKSHAFLNANYGNEAKKQILQGDQFLLINPADAGERMIMQGEQVRVYNRTGSFLGVAKITDDVPLGVVVTTVGYWRSLNETGTVNSVSAARFGGMGRCPTFSDNLVQVERLVVENTGSSKSHRLVAAE